MRSGVLLLVLLCLPALSLATSCSAGPTADAGCSECVDDVSTSDCNWCRANFYKTGAKACTVCPDGTGRLTPTATVSTEASTVCTLKSAPQLKCAQISTSNPYSCSSCPAGSYLESGTQFNDEVSVQGCSTDCKSFASSKTSTQLVPNTDSPAAISCAGCISNCMKCAFATTMKACSGASASCALGYNKQQTACSECRNGYWLKPNKDEPTTVVPTCERCGTNCKKCKDNAGTVECSECWPGWALEGTDKTHCTKSVPVSSASILKIALFSIISLLFIAW